MVFVRRPGIISNYKTLEDFRDEIRDNIGRDVIVEADQGRNRIVTKEGKLDAVFPSLFTIKITNRFNNERTVSYTYSDLLTSTVVLTYS